MTELISSKTSRPIVAVDEGEVADQWSGSNDRAERRRRQNRVNQRAFRQRKRAQSTKDVHPKSLVPSHSTSIIPRPHSSPRNDLTPTVCSSPSTIENLLNQFAQSAIDRYARGDPTTDHLITLTKVNVFRAFAQNLRILGWSEYSMADDAVSRFNTAFPHDSRTPDETNRIPKNLRPTPLQRTQPHHPWLDFFPLPKMRDNLIEAGDDWPDEQLCHDIMGFWGESALDAGLLVWGEPWDVRNWEVTEPFLKKWQWVIRGCPELMDATNSWRARRGEKLIFRYL